MTILPLGKVLPTDAEKRLRWISKQVAPAMRSLIEQGFAEQLRELLDEFYKPPQK